METDRRFWSAVAAVFALHLAATLAVTRARTGFYLFTLPVLTPIAGAESLAGRALWVLLFDVGAVAAAIAVSRLAMTDGESADGPRLTHLGRLGHVAAAAVIALLAAVLATARDEVFVVAVMQPTLSGVYGVVERPLFAEGIRPYISWIVAGSAVDVVRHVTFAVTRDGRARLIARVAARMTTAGVLAYLATGSVFNVGGFSDMPGVEDSLARAASLGLAALAVLAAVSAGRDWLRLALPATAVGHAGASVRQESARDARTDGQAKGGRAKDAQVRDGQARDGQVRDGTEDG